MKLVIGIDEAGLGPRLGPLVVAATVFRVPNDVRSKSFRSRLRGVVGKAQCRAPRLAVDDSKALYHFGSDLGALEEPLSAFWASRARSSEWPSSLTELLGLPRATLEDRIAPYPWYQGLPDRCAVFRKPAPSKVIEKLRGCWERTSWVFEGFHVRVSLEGELNDRWRAHPNKAAVHSQGVMELLHDILDETDAEEAEVVVDRLGGRIYYEELLASTFPLSPMTILRQSPAMSTYRVEHDGGLLEASFCRRGDGQFMTVALASMMAKYVRELFVESLNDYFQARCDELTKTAGYGSDAVRFLEDVASVLKSEAIDQHFLVRER